MPIILGEGQTVGGLKADLERVHSEKSKQQDLWTRLYYQDVSWLKPNVPQDVAVFPSSTPTDIVDTVADRMRTDEPSVSIRQWGTAPAARDRATLMRRWAEYVMQMDVTHAEVPAYSQASIDIPLMGEAVIKRLHNPNIPLEPLRSSFSSEDEYQEELRVWQGIMATTNTLLPARALDPANVFIPPNSSWPFPYAIEYQVRRQVQMWEDYPNFKAMQIEHNGRRLRSLGRRRLTEKDLNNPAREIVWLEYWSEDEYIVEADGFELFRKMNPYGVVPYCHVYSGLGRNDKTNNSARKAMGVLGKLLGEVQTEIEMRTLLMAATRYYIFQRLLVPEGHGHRIADAMANGNVIEVPGNDVSAVKWLDSPALSPEVSRALVDLDEKITKRVNPIGRGAPNRDVNSGVQEALATINSDTSLLKMSAAVNRLATQSMRLAAMQMTALGLRQTIVSGTNEEGVARERIVDGSKGHLDRVGAISIEFKAVDPVENSRRQQQGQRLFEGGGITQNRLWTSFLDGIIDDPEEEQIQKDAEDAISAWKNSPEFMQWSVQQFMQQEAAQQQQVQAQQGAGGGSIASQVQAAQAELAQLGGEATAVAGQQNPTAGIAEQVQQALSQAGGITENAPV